ncbi:ANTAR domain-containing protein [Actinomadura sp. KC06]|uniref:GAF and ANTAR domain-containing protein n=1 Tax=Actinomadura sp. KC06 TaxID=2530369 RepID=UPI0010430588|nr:GAF and ANTAR domain-containing protein [Actinomadura sp. KC06]TDD33079.1 ANTAR domain-containing protein [Actinomadura sp. KC06]
MSLTEPPQPDATDRSPEPASLAAVFIELADVLVTDFDVIDFLDLLVQRCTRLLGVDAVGVLVSNQQDQLQLIAASTAQATAMEQVQLDSKDGPGPDCYSAGVRIDCPDLRDEPGRWPTFQVVAAKAGYRAVHALPMRLRDQMIGTLNLFSLAPGGLDTGLLHIGQALADISTLGIASQPYLNRQATLTAQLQAALTSRVTIEQAKGIMAERHQLTPDEAFDRLRAFAHDRGLRMSDLARAVVSGDGASADFTVYLQTASQ